MIHAGATDARRYVADLTAWVRGGPGGPGISVGISDGFSVSVSVGGGCGASTVVSGVLFNEFSSIWLELHISKDERVIKIKSYIL